MEANFEQDIVECLRVLNAGGLILYPTDTIWGIGCDATDPDPVAEIFSLKRRPDEKSMIILLAEEKDILRYVAAPDPAIFNYLEQLTEPTTIIFQQGINLAENLVNADGSIALRICRDPFCKALIKRFRKPIVSTSANISGEPSPASFGDISDAIRDNVDYVVRHRQKEEAKNKASRIVKWVDGNVEVIRN